jgi:ribonuclease BN (tRNA processing enzyme)
VAVEAGARRLVLVHLPHDFDEDGPEVACARGRFPDLEIGYDGARYPLTPVAVAIGWRAVGATASHKRA